MVKYISMLGLRMSIITALLFLSVELSRLQANEYNSKTKTSVKTDKKRETAKTKIVYPKILASSNVLPTTGWNNNKETAIVPYEEFVAQGAEDIIRAVNRTGFGIANTPGFEMKAGKHYQASFVMAKSSGVHPSFRISEDQFGNSGPLVYRTSDGPMTYGLEVPKTRTYYAVFRVEDGEKTDFSVTSFRLKEVEAVK